LILGIDPGCTGGAVALLDLDEITVQTFDISKDVGALQEVIFDLPPVRLCALEQLHAGPQMGRKAVAAMFEQYGAIKAILSVRGIPTFSTRPSEWKKGLSVPADKDAARKRASEFFPLNSDQWKLKKHDGRAEAALIAWFGRKWA
jgi:hypothetical protein